MLGPISVKCICITHFLDFVVLKMHLIHTLMESNHFYQIQIQIQMSMNPMQIKTRPPVVYNNIVDRAFALAEVFAFEHKADRYTVNSVLILR